MCNGVSAHWSGYNILVQSTVWVCAVGMMKRNKYKRQCEDLLPIRPDLAILMSNVTIANVSCVVLLEMVVVTKQIRFQVQCKLTLSYKL